MCSYACLIAQPGNGAEILLHGNCCQQIAGYITPKKRVAGLSKDCLQQLSMTVHVYLLFYMKKRTRTTFKTDAIHSLGRRLLWVCNFCWLSEGIVMHTNVRDTCQHFGSHAVFSVLLGYGPQKNELPSHLLCKLSSCDACEKDVCGRSALHDMFTRHCTV